MEQILLDSTLSVYSSQKSLLRTIKASTRYLQSSGVLHVFYLLTANAESNYHHKPADGRQYNEYWRDLRKCHGYTVV